MRCPRCQQYGQELTLPGERPRIYECNTSDCAVMRFDEVGVRDWYRQPDEDDEDEL